MWTHELLSHNLFKYSWTAWSIMSMDRLVKEEKSKFWIESKLLKASKNIKKNNVKTVCAEWRHNKRKLNEYWRIIWSIKKNQYLRCYFLQPTDRSKQQWLEKNPETQHYNSAIKSMNTSDDFPDPELNSKGWITKIITMKTSEIKCVYARP